MNQLKENDLVKVKYGVHTGKTFRVVGFTRKDSLGKLITCQIDGGDYRFNFMPWQISACN